MASFGPFRVLEALPWLLLASLLRVMAFGDAVFFPICTILADLLVLKAFLAAMRHSMESVGLQANYGQRDARAQSRLFGAIFGRIGLLLISAVMGVITLGLLVSMPDLTRSALHALVGLDGVAFDQGTKGGMFWSATIAALTLLMILRAAREGEVSLFAAVRELAARFVWLGPAIVLVGVVYIGLSFGQGMVRAVVTHWFGSDQQQLIKLVVFFAYVAGFATFRLWLTLLILTYSLKNSYARQRAGDR
jgi:hypothetical protein